MVHGAGLYWPLLYLQGLPRRTSLEPANFQRFLRWTSMALAKLHWFLPDVAGSCARDFKKDGKYVTDNPALTTAKSERNRTGFTTCLVNIAFTRIVACLSVIKIGGTI